MRKHYDKDAILKEWEAGNDTMRAIAKRHGVSATTVSRVIRQAASRETGPQTVPSQAAMPKAQDTDKDLQENPAQFFNDAGLTVVRAALSRMQEEELSLAEMRHVSEIIKGQRAGIVGKSPDTAIQINGDCEVTLEQYLEERNKIVGEY
jgi:transposase-like protein